MNALKLFVVALTILCLSSKLSAEKIPDEIVAAVVPVDIISTIIPLLNDISRNWDHEILKDYLESSNFIGNEKHFKATFSKYSYLGGFKTCKKMKNIEINKLAFLVKVIKGNCEFENGEVFMQFVFSSEKADNEFAGLTIKEI